MNTYARRRREYPQLFKLPQFAHLEVVELRSPRQARAFLSGIQQLISR